VRTIFLSMDFRKYHWPNNIANFSVFFVILNYFGVFFTAEFGRLSNFLFNCSPDFLNLDFFSSCLYLSMGCSHLVDI
jgi:hypothetical protein